MSAKPQEARAQVFDGATYEPCFLAGGTSRRRTNRKDCRDLWRGLVSSDGPNCQLLHRLRAPLLVGVSTNFEDVGGKTQANSARTS